MRRTKVILWHAGAFVLLSMIFVFGVSERLIELLLPDFHQVEHWLVLVVSGVLLIGAGCLVSLWIRLRRSMDRRPRSCPALLSANSGARSSPVIGHGFAASPISMLIGFCSVRCTGHIPAICIKRAR